MQIRKNTKAFKTIVSIIEACQSRPDRDQLVRLYITKAGQTIKDRIYVEGIQVNAELFYEMNYQAITNSLKSPGHQLYVSDEVPGIYYFQGPNKTWDETPFEFAEIIAKKFSGLPELPATRKKEAVQVYALPKPKEIGATKGKVKKKVEKVKTPARLEVTKPTVPKQPVFSLKHKIEFTHLDRLVYKEGNIAKLDLLHYYDKVVTYLLPWLKDRALSVRSQSPTADPVAWTGEAATNDEPLPGWVQQKSDSGKANLLCNDRDHLLYYLELGCLEFSPSSWRFASIQTPDYLTIGIDSTDLAKTVNVALVTREVLDGLQLPSFIKTDGRSGFHIYFALDAKTDFKKSELAAEFICKLVRLKIPDLVTLNKADEMTYGKVAMTWAFDKKLNAPYSLVAGPLPLVATPLSWDELQHDLRLEDFNMTAIFKRLNHAGDIFAPFFKKKVNAGELLKRMEANYAFLI